MHVWFQSKAWNTRVRWLRVKSCKGTKLLANITYEEPFLFRVNDMQSKRVGSQSWCCFEIDHCLLLAPVVAESA